MVNCIEDLRCKKCGRVLAEADGKGGYTMGGVSVDVVTGKCPECGAAFSEPGVEILFFSGEHLAEIRKVVDIIRAKNGFGELYITFMKGKIAAIGERTEKRYNLL